MSKFTLASLVFTSVFIFNNPQFFAQEINGIVLNNFDGQIEPVQFAEIYWLNTVNSTQSDENGRFSIERNEYSSTLIISAFGYENDTVTIDLQTNLRIELQSITLEDVEIIEKSKSTEISLLNPIKTESISQKELQKAACCNLSESFETSPTVDVSFTDAVSGSRQIELLGLNGPYTQFTIENIPGIRGLTSIYGLSLIPGTWIQSIQLNKGTGSVINGFESIGGQINIELIKPNDDNKTHINAYVNDGQRYEGNAIFSTKVNSNWSTALLLHGQYSNYKNDRNNDNFVDRPLNKNFNIANRWKYKSNNRLVSQFGLSIAQINLNGGTLNFNPKSTVHDTTSWGLNNKTNNYKIWGKLGKLYPDEPYKSWGLQLSATHNEQSSYFGENNYNASEQNIYANFILSDIISDTRHKYKIGSSLTWDNTEELIFDTLYKKDELVPGLFAEYSYIPNENFNLVSGIRLDKHNNYGLFITPRLHLRYALSEKSTFRMSGGRGQRTASIFAENIGKLASNRSFVVHSLKNGNPYGLNPEIAYNYGFNYTHVFMLNEQDLTISFDVYRTDFKNQIIIDLDQETSQVHIYNLDGKSYANSLQFQFEYDLNSELSVKTAYRWYDVKSTFNNVLLERPLLSKHRAFINLTYHNKSDWMFNFTLNWHGNKRIPHTQSNPVEYRLPNYSPNFFVANLQINKTWQNGLEIYTGVENLFNFVQQNPILSNDNPSSKYFDASLIWGPIFGRNFYLGIRLNL